MSQNKLSIKVVAGIIRDPAGRVLLGQRLPGTHLAGLWEFPGGKIEAGESSAQALKRELKEELGIDISSQQAFICITHQYPEKTIQLQALEVHSWQGRIESCEQQNLQWVQVKDLASIKMPAADIPIVKAMQLPAQLRITPSCEDWQAYLQCLKSDLVKGNDFIQLRAANLSPSEQTQLLNSVACIKGRTAAKIIINFGTDPASYQNQLDGLHLKSAQLQQIQQRPIAANKLLSAACHNLEEVRQAEKIGVDFITLSPLYSTSSHPTTKVLGESAFQELCKQTNLPVYALGGVEQSDLAKIRTLGGQGVAGISAF